MLPYVVSSSYISTPNLSLNGQFHSLKLAKLAFVF